jgi:hypothetical protein
LLSVPMATAKSGASLSSVLYIPAQPKKSVVSSILFQFRPYP